MKFTKPEVKKNDSMLSQEVHWVEIVNAIEGMTKDNKPKLEITLKSLDDSSTNFIYENLSSENPYRIEKFAQCFKVLDEYVNGEIKAESLVGRKGMVEIDIDSRSEDYSQRPFIKKYL